MIVLKIIGIVLAVIALLIAVILMLWVDLLLQADDKNGFRFRVRFLGLVFGAQKKEKKKEKKKKPENPLVKALKKTLGLSHLESMKTIRSTVEDRGAVATLAETVETFFLLIDRVLWILKHCSVPQCRIVSVSGGEDAALDYGIACATVYPLVSYLQERMGVGQRKLRVDIQCDYGLAESQFELDLAIRVKIFHVLRAFLHIVKKNVEKELIERV